MERPMKNSGIEWIGSIPENWSLQPVKALVERIWDGPFGSNLKGNDYTSEGIPVVRLENLRYMQFDESKKSFVSPEKYETIRRHTVRQGDLIMATFISDDVKVAQLPLSYDYAINKADCIGIKPSRHVDLRFLQYALSSPSSYIGLLQETHGSTRERVNTTQIKMLKLPIPPLVEQKRISNFLDQKCLKIDAISTSISEEIELFEQYRRSVIHEAVTKGLNPDAPMRDSGVEWIGEIPAAWNIVPAKSHVVIHNGRDPLDEGDVPVYGAGSEPFKCSKEYKLGPTVLLGRKGTIDRPKYITGRFWNVDTAFDAYTDNLLLVKYYFYLSICFDYKRYISQTTLPSMTQTEYLNMRIPLPSVGEQDIIVSFLDKKCAEIDSIIAAKKQQLETLSQYKKSLIYEYVTGKREVPA
ncbi:restriction endonuclease subunit S [Bifidobacterium cuniculi]|uniref:Restriction modification system DNA specificity subunit n=1 Tax=Bifidobacterium cuniculi TaxID=1688 RepID=A0A087AYB5_9BIFI|nr:restriction endonuclease subunit S [Bifidobacterium cuniculi]KFI63765.1 restriction modification system DNA specificity subunit [Bifidobacterium cuniculi]